MGFFICKEYMNNLKILDEINDSIINIKSRELSDNYNNVVHLNDKLERFIINYVNKYHHDFLTYINNKNNKHNKLDRIIRTYKMINTDEIVNRIRIYNNILNNLQECKKYNMNNNYTFNFNRDDILTLKSTSDVNYFNVYNNFLLDEDKFLMLGKLSIYKYILESSQLNTDMIPHLRIMINICNNRDNRKIYKHFDKNILKNKLVIISKLINQTPNFYQKHIFTFNIIYNLLRVL